MAMSITPETVVAIIYFLLPGYVGLRVFEWRVAGSVRTTFDEVVWSLLLTTVGATPLLAWQTTRALVEHLWKPAAFDLGAILGVALHLLSTVLVALAAAQLARRIDKTGWTRASIFGHSWDALWAPIAGEDRKVCVESSTGIYYGDLLVADRGQVGRDLVLRNPERWDDKTNTFVSTGAELMHISGDSISSVQISTKPMEVAQ